MPVWPNSSLLQSRNHSGCAHVPHQKSARCCCWAGTGSVLVVKHCGSVLGTVQLSVYIEVYSLYVWHWLCIKPVMRMDSCRTTWV